MKCWCTYSCSTHTREDNIAVHYCTAAKSSGAVNSDNFAYVCRNSYPQSPLAIMSYSSAFQLYSTTQNPTQGIRQTHDFFKYSLHFVMANRIHEEVSGEGKEAQRLRRACENIIRLLDDAARSGRELRISRCGKRHVGARHATVDPGTNSLQPKDSLILREKEGTSTFEDGMELSPPVNEANLTSSLASRVANDDDDECENVQAKSDAMDTSSDENSNATSGQHSWESKSVGTIETDEFHADFIENGNNAKVEWLEWLNLVENGSWTLRDIMQVSGDNADDFVNEPRYGFVPVHETGVDSDNGDTEERAAVRFNRTIDAIEAAWIENPWKYWSGSVLDPRIRGRLLLGPLRYPDGVTGMAVGLSERCGEAHNHITTASRLYAPVAILARRYLQEGRGMELFHIDQYIMQAVGYGRITQMVTFIHSTTHLDRCMPATRPSLITVARGGCPNAVLDEQTAWKFERANTLACRRSDVHPNPQDKHYRFSDARTPGLILSGRQAVSELLLVIRAQDIGFAGMFLNLDQVIVNIQSNIDNASLRCGRRLSVVVDPAAMTLGDIRESAARVLEEQETRFKLLGNMSLQVSFQDIADHVIDVGFDSIARIAFREFIESNPVWLEERFFETNEKQLKQKLVQDINSCLNRLDVDERRKRCLKEAARAWYEEIPPVPWLWVLQFSGSYEISLSIRRRLLKEWCMTAEDTLLIATSVHHFHEKFSNTRNTTNGFEDEDKGRTTTAYLASYPEEGVEVDPEDDMLTWPLSSEPRIVRERSDKVVFELSEVANSLPLRRGFELVHSMFLMEHIGNQNWLICRVTNGKLEVERAISANDITYFLTEQLSIIQEGEDGDQFIPKWFVEGVKVLTGMPNLNENEDGKYVVDDEQLNILKDWIILAMLFSGYADMKKNAACTMILMSSLPAMEVVWPEPVTQISEVVQLPANCRYAEQSELGYLSLAWDERSWLVARGSVVSAEINSWHLEESVGVFDYPLGAISKSVVAIGDFWSTLTPGQSSGTPFRGDIRYVQDGVHTLREVLQVLSASYGLTFTTAYSTEGKQWGLYVQSRKSSLRRQLKKIRSVKIKDIGIEVDPTPVGVDASIFIGSGWMITSLSDLQYVVSKHVEAVDKEGRSKELGCGPKELSSCVLLATRIWKNLRVTGNTKWLDTVGTTSGEEGGFRVDVNARLPLCLGIAGVADDGERWISILLQSGNAYIAKLADVVTSSRSLDTLHLTDARIEDIASGNPSYMFYKQSTRALMM